MRQRICLILAMTLAIIAAHCMGQAAAPDQQRQTALALEQQGESSEAEAAWRLYMKAHPSNPEPYAHLGLLEARQDHYKEAVLFYRRALALNPAIPGLRLDLGLALFKGGEPKQAIVEFKMLLKNEPPGSSEAQRLTMLLGMAHYGLEEYAAAAPYLKQAAAHDPQNLPLRLALAHSCLWSKQYQCVLDTYHQILMLNAESAEADMLAGEAQDELKNTGDAVQEFRDAEKANPREPDVHFGLGYLLWRLKQYEEAAQEFQAELANNPEHGQAMAYLGDTEMILGQPEPALPLLEKSIQIDPRIELAHLDLGILYGNAGRQDEALRELKTAETLNPHDQNVHWRLGRFYQEMGRKDEAKIEFDKTRSLVKTADDTTFKKLHPTAEAPGAPAAR
ncbi:MAG: tetratricopeptide repeat protein [Candidatus Korobacteraceae bacterium]